MPSVIETIHNRYAVRRFAATPVPDDVLLAILDAGRRSQSSKNTQPWQFRISEGDIEILPDFSRRIPVVDPDNHHIFASLGCAAENLALAAAARGQTGELRFEPTNEGSVKFSFGTDATSGRTLFDAIPFRHLPDNHPAASGLHVNTPIPCRRHTGKTSFSAPRTSMERMASAASATLVIRATTNSCGNRRWSIAPTDQPSGSSQMLRKCRPSTFMTYTLVFAQLLEDIVTTATPGPRRHRVFSTARDPARPAP